MNLHVSVKTNIEKGPPSGSALADLALRCIPRKGLTIPFGLCLAQVHQEHPASLISMLTER